jgi:hypothetical protein
MLLRRRQRCNFVFEVKLTYDHYRAAVGTLMLGHRFSSHLARSQLADSIVRQFMAIIGSLQSPSVSQHAGIGMFLLSGFTLRVLSFSTGGGKGQVIDRRIKAHPVDAVTVSESRDFYTSDEQRAIRSHWLERDHEHAYLKEVLGEDALTFVREQNRLCLSQFGDPSSTPLYAKILSILDSQEKIPYLRKYNDLYYNFWQDHSNPRGVWRRISMESYLSSSPAWEVVIDFDELGRLEGESWVYKGRRAIAHMLPCRSAVWLPACFIACMH